ncbi:MAG: hydrolase [Legionellales bacterium RIFCSPHIGHO2_12_FULL_35_11]|nr:MAG: hydrolase [Legionellales bacterium RIFCSPHIGHO2_12_FULL_35_11]
MLLQKEHSCLLLIDVQEKLTPLVLNPEKLISNCQWIMRLASELDVPLLVSEHYSKGLGSTIEPLRKIMPGKTDIDKVHFSCYRDNSFLKYWQNINKKQAVIVGIETHVCVLQTALDLLQAGYEVFVVVDSVSARYQIDHQFGLERMKSQGVQLVTLEMVFFEWMDQAGTAAFKDLSKAFLKNGN